VAWVSLDEGDNDPARLWIYISEALRRVQPGVAAAALEALHRTSVDYLRVALPSLLNDLSGISSPLVLVLDDYHLVTDATCHQSVAFFLQHLPANVRLLLATRVDPPLALAGMRARGELAELRGAELRFTGEEADALLNGAMGLELAPGDVARLAERTEGWAAGLYLAGLSLHAREDTGGFIAAFSGDHRHVADYLTADVLARQPASIRTFLLRSSILRRLSGPLCDDVLEADGSTELLEELERSNLFLVPLDDHRQWYRYHQLFGELLRLELGSREPALVRVLHGRASDWHHRAGDVEEAVHHAAAAGEFANAGGLIASHWLAYWRRGRRATVGRWVAGLPEEAVMADPPVAFVAAWIGGYSGASKQQCDRWLAVVEAADGQGPLPDGISSLAFGAALTRASVPFDDAGRSLRAARRAFGLAGPGHSPFHWMAQAALGHALYLSGRPAEARPPLEELVGKVSAAGQPYAVMTGLAVLSLLASDAGEDQAAASLADHAETIVEAHGLSAEPLAGIVRMALGRVLARQGNLTQAQEQLEWSLALFGIDGMALHRAHALLLLAAVRHGQGDLPGARHQLHVSVNTIRSQVQAIYRKLEVMGRTDAVTQARRLGLVPRVPPTVTVISPR